MPRVARRRDSKSTHHIICKSISEFTLFHNDTDKVKYIHLMGIYCNKFKCSVLSYCLMDTHVHIQFDPQGCDISKFMHGLNLCYAMYYNKKYHRSGPVFGGRFKNIVIEDDVYNLAVSAYIHNNPKDLPDFRDCIHTYVFSSFGMYLGHNSNHPDMLNTDFILSQFANDPVEARKLYAEFVSSCNKTAKKEKIYELIDDFTCNESFEYKSERCIYPREFKPVEVIDTIAKTLNITNPNMIHVKYNHKNTEYRSLCVFFMRCLCDYSYKDICKVIGNISLSQVSKLCSKGYVLIISKTKYSVLLTSFFESPKVL